MFADKYGNQVTLGAFETGAEEELRRTATRERKERAHDLTHDGLSLAELERAVFGEPATPLSEWVELSPDEQAARKRDRLDRLAEGVEDLKARALTGDEVEALVADLVDEKLAAHGVDDGDGPAAAADYPGRRPETEAAGRGFE